MCIKVYVDITYIPKRKRKLQILHHELDAWKRDMYVDCRCFAVLSSLEKAFTEITQDRLIIWVEFWKFLHITGILFGHITFNLYYWSTEE